MIEQFIYHIISKDEWEFLEKKTDYHPDSLQIEGFIHFSFQCQVCDTAARYYPNRSDLMVMKVFVPMLTSLLKIDPVTESASFPHLYGPLNMNAVIKTIPLTLNQDGSYSLCEEQA